MQRSQKIGSCARTSHKSWTREKKINYDNNADTKSTTKRKQKRAFRCRFQTPSSDVENTFVRLLRGPHTAQAAAAAVSAITLAALAAAYNPRRVYFRCCSVLGPQRRSTTHSLIPRRPAAGSQQSALGSRYSWVWVLCGTLLVWVVRCSLVCVVRFAYKYMIIIKKYTPAYIDVIILFCTLS